MGPAAYGEAHRDHFTYEQKAGGNPNIMYLTTPNPDPTMRLSVLLSGSDILRRVMVNAVHRVAEPIDTRDTHVMRDTAHSGARRFARTLTLTVPMIP